MAYTRGVSICCFLGVPFPTIFWGTRAPLYLVFNSEIQVMLANLLKCKWKSWLGKTCLLACRLCPRSPKRWQSCTKIAWMWTLWQSFVDEIDKIIRVQPILFPVQMREQQCFEWLTILIFSRFTVKVQANVRWLTPMSPSWLHSFRICKGVPSILGISEDPALKYAQSSRHWCPPSLVVLLITKKHQAKISFWCSEWSGMGCSIRMPSAHSGWQIGWANKIHPAVQMW